jgi:hypothetical protein
MKKNNDQEPKSMLGRWRKKRKANPMVLPGTALESSTAPMPPGEPSPGVPDPASSAGRKDDGGRPAPRIHSKKPIGGPFRGGG